YAGALNLMDDDNTTISMDDDVTDDDDDDDNVAIPEVESEVEAEIEAEVERIAEETSDSAIHIQVARKILATFGVDMLIPHEWLRIEFKYPELNLKDSFPKGSTPDKWQKLQLLYMVDIEKTRRHLLVEYKRDMQNLHGKGYTLLRPNKQTGEAVRDGEKGFAKSIRKMGSRIRNVDKSALSPEESRHNADAETSLQSLKSIMTRSKISKFVYQAAKKRKAHKPTDKTSDDDPPVPVSSE
ncbi:hypothetical protein LCGC14_3132410, partial [marine sediment metagenome]